MTSDPRQLQRSPRQGFDFVDVDPRETSKAWNRFLSHRNAPSLPMPGVRQVIYQSWVRSTSTGIKPDQFAAPSLERSTPLAKSTYDHAELRRATRATMARIGDLLCGAEAMLLLTDRDGVILETVGDKSTLSKASKINLNVGGIWSEDASGTNGIGTALWMGQPVYVHGEEHFCEGMKAWSCAAAPIRDPIDHSIIGVINLSGLTSIFQKHNAAFAATAARDIELVLEQEQSLLNIRLMEAIIGKYPAGQSEGLAIVDRFGRLIFSRDGAKSFGARFLELPEGISEERILSALPRDKICEDLRLIEIDGTVKGAAMVLRHRGASRPVIKPLPGVEVGKTGLKIVGESEAIRAALDMAERIASVDAPALIEGETGVGKELFARAIHARLGGTRFQPVNCSAMAPHMFERAALQGEAVILDELGETTPESQLYLLRVLEERDSGPRLISLTNRVLRDEVEAGRFRRDLYYRLSAVTLTIPPLRDRGNDILLIAEHYNRKISLETGRELLQFSADAQEALMEHPWPGNVRELRNLVAGLHGLAKSRQVTRADLPAEITAPRPPVAVAPVAPASLKDAEMRQIEDALRRHHGNLSKAALALGISRPTLYRKIESHGIKAG